MLGRTMLTPVMLAALALSCTAPESAEESSRTTAPMEEPTVGVAEDAQPLAPPPRDQVRVGRVIDGDTIELADGRRVRYIGIDTPETVDPSQPAGCFGREASDRNKALVEGKTVLLEKDVSETDRFGRLLRYVYVGDEMVNQLLVFEGYAQVSTFPPDVKYQDQFSALQQQARNAGRGLWGPACAPTPVPPAAAPPPPSGPSPSSGNCSPAYPAVCIPPPPPDLDCPQISHRRFQVLPPDPQRFDSDADGIGCESG
jgi:micrococcal nuclease